MAALATGVPRRVQVGPNSFVTFLPDGSLIREAPAIPAGPRPGAKGVTGSIAGTLTDSLADPIVGAFVNVRDSNGNYYGSAETDSNGQYQVDGLSTGSFLVETDAGFLGFVDELYNNVTCLYFYSCDRNSATQVSVTAGSTTSGIDFQLADGGDITGTLTDGSNNPIASVDVFIRNLDRGYIATGFTDSNGFYRVRGLADGSYLVETGASSAGFQDEVYDDITCLYIFGCDLTSATEVVVTAGAETSGIDFQLAEGGSISGTLTDASMNPVVGVYVDIYDSGGSYVSYGYTDSSGFYQVNGLSPGDYFALTYTFSAFVDELYDDIPCNPCDVTTGTPISVSVGQTTANIDFQLAEGGSISGTLTDADSSNPIPSVYVDIFDPGGSYVTSGFTDSNGNYEAGGLLTGSYRVKTYAQFVGYIDEVYDDRSCAGGCSVTSGDAVAVTQGQATTGIDFALVQGGSISGTLTDAQTNDPIPSVWVDVYDSGGTFVTSDLTDSNGGYEARGLLTGSYRVRTDAAFAGYLDELYDDRSCAGGCTVTGGDPVAVTQGQVTANIDFALDGGGSITGTLTDAQTSDPIPSVYVDIYDAGGFYVNSGFTDSNGFYEVNGLPAGNYYALTYTFSAFKDELYDDILCDFCDVTTGTPISVTAGQTTAGIDFALDAGGRVTGTLTDGLGSPISGAYVNVRDINGSYYGSAQTDSNGQYQVGGLPTGNFLLETDAGYLGFVDELYDNVPCLYFYSCDRSSATQVSVVDGSTTAGIDFELAVGGDITGTLTDTGGNPIAGVYVNVRDLNLNFISYGYTDSNGFYRVGGLTDGSYLVETDAGFKGFLDEVYDDVQCLNVFSCDLTNADAVMASAATETGGIDFVLSSGGGISGTVTDSLANPIPSVYVDIYNSAGSYVTTGFTDSGGFYEAGGLASGNYFALTYNFSSFVNELYDNIPCDFCDVTAGNPIAVTAGQTTTDIDFELAEGGSITGTVTDAQTNAAIPSVYVYVYDEDGFYVTGAVTNSSGDYEAGGLLTGSYRVITYATFAGYIDEVYDNHSCAAGCSITGGDPVAVSLGMETANVDFALDEGGSISGTITDTGSNPISGVDLDVFDDQGNYVSSSAVSDSNGDYTLSGLAPGSYFVLANPASSQGYFDELYQDIRCVRCDPTSGTPVTVETATETPGIDFELELGGSISGKLTDAQTAAAIPYAYVYVYDSNGFFINSGSTDVDGNYTVGGLTTGSYRVITDAGFVGYINELYDNLECVGGCSVTGGTPVQVVEGATTPDIDFALDPGGSISGFLTDAQSDVQDPDPIVFALVEVRDGDGFFFGYGFTDSNGRYEVNGLPGGDYLVRTRARGNGFIDELYDDVECANFFSCDRTNAEFVSVVVEQVTSGVDFALEPGGSIAGALTDAQSGGPISFVSVWIYDQNGFFITSGFTDTNGGYEAKGLPAGSYLVQTGASSAGYIDELYDNIPCAGDCDISIGYPVSVAQEVVTRNIDFALEEGGTIAGTVTSGNGAEAVAFSRVEVRDANGEFFGSDYTDLNGHYEVRGLPAGDYLVRTDADSNGYVDELFDDIPCASFFSCDRSGATQVAAIAGQTTGNIDFDLVLGGSIGGTVTDAQTTNPVQSAFVDIFDSQGSYVTSGYTDINGTYTARGLPSGDYFAVTFTSFIDELYDDIVCEPFCDVVSGMAIAVTEGQATTGIDFALAEGGSIQGTVTDANTSDPDPISGTFVDAYNSSGEFAASGFTDVNGGYTISGLAADSYFVQTTTSLTIGGFIDELYDDQACEDLACDVTSGNPVTVTDGAATTGIDFALLPINGIFGTVTDANSGSALALVEVNLYDASGVLLDTVTTATNGTYGFENLSDGGYYVASNVTSGAYQNEIYNNIACGTTCDPLSGTLLTISGAPRTGINLALSPLGQGADGPDLVVSRPIVTPTSPAEGQGYSLRVTVSNIGNQASTATDLIYYRSDDSTITTDDFPVDTKVVIALSEDTDSLKIANPNDRPPAGTYWFGACVTSVTGEANTSNNCSPARQAEVIALEPELGATLAVVATVDADDDGQVTPGDTINFRVLISNSGNGAAKDAELRIREPDGGSLLGGTITTDQGIISPIFSTNDYLVVFGDIASGASNLAVNFGVQLVNPFPITSNELATQGELTGNNFSTLFTDDPSTTGTLGDATLTTVFASPSMFAELDDFLLVDNDRDGKANPSDVVRYFLALENTGNQAAGPITMTVTPPEGLVVADDRVRFTTGFNGNIVSGNGPSDSTIEVVIPSFEGGGARDEVVTFDLAVADPLPPGTSAVAVLGDISVDNNMQMLTTDDPSTGFVVGDATRISVGGLRRIPIGTLLESGDEKGAAIAVGEAFVAVGIPKANGGTGLVDIYEINDDGTVTYHSTLEVPPEYSFSEFGAALDLDGDTLVVGAPGDTPVAKGASKLKAGVFKFNSAINKWSMAQALSGTGNKAADRFGSSVKVDGNTILVGAPEDADETESVGSGAAYVYKVANNTVSLTEKVKPPSEIRKAGAKFGASIAGSDGNVAVGAPGSIAGATAGSAVLYSTIAENLSPPVTIAVDTPGASEFGSSIAMSGNTLVVGAPASTLTENASGGVFVYDFNASGATIDVSDRGLVEPGDPVANGRFGHAVAINGQQFVAGSPGALASTQDARDAGDSSQSEALGAIYRYTIAAQIREAQKVGAFVGNASVGTTSQAGFGTSVSMSGEAIAIGAPMADGASGAASIQLGVGAVLFADGFEGEDPPLR